MGNAIGARIKRLRSFLKINQTEFSAPLGIDRSHIAGIENGSRNPSEPLLRLISITYCVNLTWLKKGEGEMFISPEKSIKKQVDYFGEQVIINALANIVAGYSLSNKEDLPIQTDSQSLSAQMAQLKDTIKLLVVNHGKQNLRKIIFEVLDIPDPSPEILDITTHNRRAYDKEPELRRMVDTLYTIFSTDDERLKNWASVQFDRAFPTDIVEEAEKKHKENQNQVSAG